MALTKLKRALEDAQAFQDRSSGKETLRDVLVEMAKTGIVFQTLMAGTTTTGQKNAVVFPFPVRLISLTILVNDTGDSGQTDVEIASGAGTHVLATVLNSEADGTVKTALAGEGGLAGISAEFPANTEISMEVSAAPGAGSGADVVATALLSPIDVEA